MSPRRPPEKGRLTRGRTKRALQVGGLATSVGSSYAWNWLSRPFRSDERKEQSLLDTHIRNALRVVEGSKDLKGAFMKLVQILSMRDDLLPAEALGVLSVVQSQVPPMDYDLIRRQIHAELGEHPEKLFASFEHDAFAAASLGQVHHAVLHDGREVVVKVQYPGVEETVEQDLKNIAALLRAFTRLGRDVMRQKIDHREVIQELHERLREELDYVNEARNMQRFAELLRDDPEVVIPEVVGELSARRVLTMTRIDGYPVKEIMQPGVDQSLKDWVAIKLFQLTWRQVFSFGVLHTDPHPGNYIVTYHPKIGILDFGSIRVFPEKIRRAYRDLGRAILDGDEAAMAKAFIDLGFLDPGDDPQPMIRIMRIVFEPVLSDAEYDPRDYDSFARGMEIAQIGIDHRLFKAPGHRVFLDRALIGLDSYLKQLGTVTNWYRLFRQCIDEAPA